MPRARDLRYVELDLAACQAEAQESLRLFQTYSEEVTRAVRLRLQEAGILDEVETLEKERERARTELQEKVTRLNARAGDLEKVRAYLRELPPEEKMPPELEPPLPPVPSPRASRRKPPRPRF